MPDPSLEQLPLLPPPPRRPGRARSGGALGEFVVALTMLGAVGSCVLAVLLMLLSITWGEPTLLLVAPLLGGYAAVMLLTYRHRDAAWARWLLGAQVLVPAMVIGEAIWSSSPTGISWVMLAWLAVAVGWAAVIVVTRPGTDAAPEPSVARDRDLRPGQRVRTWVTVAGAYVAVCLVSIVAHEVHFHRAPPRELLATDFRTSAAPFPVGDQDGYTASTADGDYVMTQTADAAPDADGAVPRRAFLSRGTTRSSENQPLDVTVEVHQHRAGSGQPTAVGVGCAPGTSVPFGVVMLVSPDGTDIRLVDEGGGRTSPEPSELIRVTGDQPPQRLRLACGWDFALEGGSPSVFTGYVNDHEVFNVRRTARVGPPWSVVLAFEGDGPGTEARFGDVRASGR